MGSLDEVLCENPETSFRFPEASQTYITNTPPWAPLLDLAISASVSTNPITLKRWQVPLAPRTGMHSDDGIGLIAGHLALSFWHAPHSRHTRRRRSAYV